MPASFHFSDADRELIASAVEKAEGLTSGEIVPVIVASSSEYPEADWKAIFIGVGAGIMLYEGYLLFFGLWLSGLWASIIGLPLFVIAGAFLGWGLARFSPVFRRIIIARSAMDTAVHDRAIKAFVDHEVFATKERTGIVLLVSLFENRVEVLGDTGINSKVSSEDWSEVISDVISGIKQGNPTAGIVEGINRCALLLKKLGVEIRSDDTDELSNMPRFEH